MLYLTYNVKTDGLGGQYQRIISIIALAKKYGVEYLHNPITEMEHLPSHSYLKTIEEYFQIKNHFKQTTDFTYDQIMEIDQVSEELILAYKCIENKVFLIKIGYPSKILDANPNLFNVVMPQLRGIKQNLLLPYYSSEKTNIAVHIRRGDIHYTEKNIRYTPVEYFENIIQNIRSRIPNTNICIFTEITDENRDEFKRFECLDNVQIVADEDILLTFEHLVRADILVMCRSSFSYIAGLYNENMVIYMNFWHSPLPQWKKIKS